MFQNKINNYIQNKMCFIDKPTIDTNNLDETNQSPKHEEKKHEGGQE